MNRQKLVFLFGVLGFCSAEGGGEAAANSSLNSDTCETSTVDYCVRTCCPPEQNFVYPQRSCTPGTLKWTPTFLSGEASLKVVERPIAECVDNEEMKAFAPHRDASMQFQLQKSGELSVSTSKGVYDLGHNYCFRNIEHGGSIFETVRSCVPKVAPQVPGLVSIDNVTQVTYHKCCPDDQVLAINTETKDFHCVNGSFDWLPDVLHGDPTGLTQLPFEKTEVKAGNDSFPMFECPRNTVRRYLHPNKEKYYLQVDGRLLVITYNLTLKEDRFCLDLMPDSGPKAVIAFVCYEESEKHTKEEFKKLCPEGVCARKCCAPGFMLDQSDCIASTVSEWQPSFHDGESVVSTPINHTLLHGISACDGHVLTFNRVGEGAPLLQVNGDLQVLARDISYEAHQCCLDHVKHYDNDAQRDTEVETALCCEPINREKIAFGYVTSTLLTISATCLFVLLVIYMLVPSLRNVHGKCLMSHAAALFVAFFLTALNYFIGLDLGPGCDALGEIEILI